MYEQVDRELEDKLIVVTGGTGVLLLPAVRRLIKLDAQVILLSRQYPEKLMQEYEGVNRQPVFISVDVSDKSQLISARDEIIDRFGKVDVLINGAGGNQPAGTTHDDQRFFDLQDEAIQQIFGVNYFGTFYTSQVFGEIIAAQGSGVILNISSVAADKPLSRVVSYASAKAAIDNFTRWLAVHMARTYSDKIRVNAIAPGFLLTKQNEYLLLERDGRMTERGKQILQATPMGRFGTPEEIIGTILWLITSSSRFVTGVVVPVDGGFSAESGV